MCVNVLDRDKLQRTLQKLESVDIIDLARLMDMHVDDLLLGIQDEILFEFKAMYKKNALKIPFFNAEKTKEFFTNQIIDLGKHETFAHRSFYGAWLLNRGY